MTSIVGEIGLNLHSLRNVKYSLCDVALERQKISPAREKFQSESEEKQIFTVFLFSPVALVGVIVILKTNESQCLACDIDFQTSHDVKVAKQV